MALHMLLPIVGRINKLIFEIPVVGELVVRAHSRAVGTLAFKAPLFGSEPANHIGQVKDSWLRFLGLVGLETRVVEVTDGAFELEMDRCPYGFDSEDDKDVCDACMDLDRIYMQHLRGRFEIVDRIPHGSHACRFRVSFP
jgi:hypothetical protein